MQNIAPIVYDHSKNDVFTLKQKQRVIGKVRMMMITDIIMRNPEHIADVPVSASPLPKTNTAECDPSGNKTIGH